MKMIKDKEFLRNIAHHINLFNTIGGGVSETYVNIKKHRKGAAIQVWAAGVDSKSFKIVLHNNQLTILSMLHSSGDAEVAIPLFNRTYMLPPQVDLTRIEAIHKHGQLQIKLPYHDAATYPKEIEIQQL
ncbi:Hsp20 family protein [Pontibacter qinzhouensis]|uniref:Hsp20 family protein n=1 Tax=Pontibacter qinzhouensis TaxID=2603253 RepID=A0A5C8KAS1_9BACT|nr:Hsp20 family protein [Pontibacter qinzhouensis]TXK52013.1 Hsp20 family protein [Pontibacter qinzhouensis]